MPKSILRPCFGIVLGLASLSVSSIALAAPLSCSSIYVTDNGKKPVYEINTSTAVLTTIGTLAGNSQIGIAVLPGVTPTLYSDGGAATPLNLQSFNGTTGTNLPTVKFSSNYGGGLGLTTTNQLFYIAKTGTTQYIYRFPNTSTTAVQVAATTGDTVWGNLTPGDMMTDANGRLYYFGSDGSGGGTNNFLYFVDSTNTAHRLGAYVGPSAGVGVAFDPAGKIFTIHGSALYKIDMTNGFVATSIGTAKLAGVTDNLLIDMGSCALPNMNPVITAVKTVRDVTTAQSPALSVNTNDILEYSTLYTNTGNLPSDGTRFIDTIPPGTVYVAGSTKMCNSTGVTCTAVADVSGAAPFLGTGALVYSPGQAAGIVLAGAANAAVIKFQVKVTSTGTPDTIVNMAQATYPTVASGGVVTINTINTNSTGVPFNFPAHAVADSGTGISGTASTPIANIAANDTVNSAAATLGSSGNATVAVSGTWPTGFTLDPLTGAVAMASTVVPGTYNFDYQLCDKSAPTPKCQTVTDTVTVSAATADIAISKSNGTASVLPGATTTYSVTVTNNGPDAANGTVIKDTPGAGLTCAPGNAVTITGSGAPSGSFTVADITGAGITLGPIPNGQTVTLTYSCTVNL